ncbi:hypothetical protein HDF26_005087 [Pedobacter cryoconitis]|nr:hypothetical protein [Pedobacter cryoconitis]
MKNERCQKITSGFFIHILTRGVGKERNPWIYRENKSGENKKVAGGFLTLFILYERQKKTASDFFYIMDTFLRTAFWIAFRNHFQDCF